MRAKPVQVDLLVDTNFRLIQDVVPDQAKLNADKEREADRRKAFEEQQRDLFAEVKA